MRPLGLRTLIFRVADLTAVRDWYEGFFATPPYFDEPFYVGFNVAGYELGLLPTENSAPPVRGAIGYWGFDDIDEAWDRLINMGAVANEEIRDVGGGIRIGSVRDPFGNIFGVIDNPGFSPDAD